LNANGFDAFKQIYEHTMILKHDLLNQKQEELREETFFQDEDYDRIEEEFKLSLNEADKTLSNKKYSPSIAIRQSGSNYKMRGTNSSGGTRAFHLEDGTEVIIRLSF